MFTPNHTLADPAPANVVTQCQTLMQASRSLGHRGNESAPAPELGARPQARQLVRHGHFLVNGSQVNIPSYLVRVNDLIAIREKSKKIVRLSDSLAAVDRRGVPQWLELDKDNFRGKIKSFPAREDFTMPIREQLIVELYSK